MATSILASKEIEISKDVERQMRETETEKKEKEIWRLDITAPPLGARNKGVDFGSSQSSN